MQTPSKSYYFCGHEWITTMEGGRRIHPESPWVWYDDGCVSIIDGEFGNVVELEMKRYPKEIKYWNGKVYNPTHAGGVFRSKEPFGHGEFSAEVCLPEGKNLWPSFWLVGDSAWPFGGEIDICEAWSDNYGEYFRMFIPQFPYLCPSWKTTTNVHFADQNSLKHQSIGSRNIPIVKQFSDPSMNFVKYGCKWTADEIVITANNKVVRRDKKAAKVIQDYYDFCEKEPKMFVIFNLWVDDPSKFEVGMRYPMYVRRFNYKGL